MKRLFDYDALTGTSTWFVDDPENDGFRLVTETDVEPILDSNKALAADKSHWKAGGDMRLEASIPMTVLLDWATKDGVPMDMVFSDEYAKKIVGRLNSSEFRSFKTADVTI